MKYIYIKITYKLYQVKMIQIIAFHHTEENGSNKFYPNNILYTNIQQGVIAQLIINVIMT